MLFLSNTIIHLTCGVEFSQQSVCQYFIERFGKKPLLVRSPGRINLIGEHTDYNDGFVMPAAINKEIYFAFAPSETSQSTFCALNMNDEVTLDLVNPQPLQQHTWANYLLGVARQFVDRGFTLMAMNCVMGGNIPVGSGLSSSAAMEGGFAYGLNEINKKNFSRVDLAQMGQWSEHQFVGVRCGIMDQFANMMGKEHQVIQLDCRSLQFQYVPFHFPDYSIVLFNSGVKHSLASSEYNNRRAECEEGLQLISKKNQGVAKLRDVTLSMLEESKSILSANIYKRCKYVIEEIGRVHQATDDLQRHDLISFGKKMYQTHAGLSALYEVSCEELDFLVSIVQDDPHVPGARMMGGGFGGCTINIVQREFVQSIQRKVGELYKRRFNIDVESYIVDIKNGTSLLPSNTL